MLKPRIKGLEALKVAAQVKERERQIRVRKGTIIRPTGVFPMFCGREQIKAKPLRDFTMGRRVQWYGQIRSALK